MSLKDFNKEQLKNKSMLELARHILEDTNTAVPFQELYDQVTKLKGLTKKDKEAKISQFFTELNVDGRFMTPGSNAWGLKRWYPVDQADEEVAPVPKKSKTTKKKAIEEEDELLLEPDDEVVELGAETIEVDDDDDDDDDEVKVDVIKVDDDEEEVDEFEELDVEKEDLEEEITLDEDDEEDEEEKI